MVLGKVRLKIANKKRPTSVGWEIQTEDRRGKEGGTAIFSELKIADFPGLCVASLIGTRIQIIRQYIPV